MSDILASIYPDKNLDRVGYELSWDRTTPTNIDCIESCILEDKCNATVFYTDNSGPVCSRSAFSDDAFMSHMFDGPGITVSKVLFKNIHTVIQSLFDRAIRLGENLPVYFFTGDDSNIYSSGFAVTSDQPDISGRPIKAVWVPPNTNVQIFSGTQYTGDTITIKPFYEAISTQVGSVKILSSPGETSANLPEIANRIYPTAYPNKKPQKIDITLSITPLGMQQLMLLLPRLRYVCLNRIIDGGTQNVGFAFSDTPLIDSDGSLTLGTSNPSCPSPTLQPCPVNCTVIGDWGEWSACSSSGTKTRSKPTITAKNGGTSCSEQTVDTATCPVDCKITGDWGNWSACDAQGLQTRSKPFTPAINGGAACSDPTTETKNCPVNCVLGDWNDWKCDRRSGIKTRRRNYTEGAYGGVMCDQKSLSETASCDPIDCKYNESNVKWFACDPISNTQTGIYTDILNQGMFGGQECNLKNSMVTVPCTPSCNYQNVSGTCDPSTGEVYTVPIFDRAPEPVRSSFRVLHNNIAKKEKYDEDVPRDTGKNYRDKSNQKRLVRNIIFGLLFYGILLAMIYIYTKSA